MDENRPGTANRPSTSQQHNQSEQTPANVNSNRPISRKYGALPATARPGHMREASAMGDRPMSKIARLQSALRPGSGYRQGSAMRPHSRSGLSIAGQIPLHAQVNVADRPVTQQGVSGIRSLRTGYGQRRVIHDKSYYMGLLHTKMTEINSEISKLNSISDGLAKEQATYTSYEKRVKELASELIELQGELADYNLLVDLLSSDKDKAFLEEEIGNILRENRSESQRVEAIYNKRRETERQVAELEERIQEEKNKAEVLVQSLDPLLQKRYESFQQMNMKLQQNMEDQQAQLDALNQRKSDLYERISKSEIKRRAVALEEELLEAEEKRDAMSRDSESRETPEEERERLLAQVKIDNGEISTLERQIAEANEELRIIQEELHGMDQEIEENDSERQQKFRELKKREQEIEEFMRNFDENKSKELEGIHKLEAEIMKLMEKITKNLHLASTIPEAGQGINELKEDMEFKEEEFDKAKYTTEMIESRNESLVKQLNNFENLEEKMKTELKTLEEKMTQMKSDMKKYQDTEVLKTEASEKSLNLQEEINSYEEKSKGLSEIVQTLQIEHDKLKADLESNEVYKQLSGLESKWSNLEQKNFEINSYLKKKKLETDFENAKNDALKFMKEYNGLLSQTIKN